MKKAVSRPPGEPAPRRPAALARLQALAAALRPDRVFLGVGLAFGLALVFLTPPFEVPDEDNHFRRALELSEGRVVALKQGDVTGDYVAPGVQALFDRFRHIRVRPDRKTSARNLVAATEVALDGGDREFVPFSNTAIHSPVPYLPQTIAVGVTRHLTASALVCLYAGRLLNLFAAVGITFVAVRLTPVAKWGFVALALTPMALALDASLSPDALTNAVAFLLVAEVLALAFGPDERVSSRALVALAVTGMAIGLAKQAYFLLPLCYLMIPVRKLGTGARYWGALAGVLAATFLAVAGWGLVVRQVYSPVDASFGMNPAEQMARMTADPLGFVRAVAETVRRSDLLGEEYLGWLGLVDLRLPTALYLAEVALLLFVFVGSHDGRWQLTARQALVALGVAALVSLTVLVVIHITWDAVGSGIIGVQGRYFIPVGPLVGIAVARLTPRAAPALSRAVPCLATVAIPVLLATSVACVYVRYFADTNRSEAARLTAEAEALLQQNGQAQKARTLFEEAVRLDPDNPRAHLSLGVLLRRERPAEAAEHLKAVLKQDPDDVAALNNLANIHRDQGDFPEAIRLYRAALKVRPEETDLQRNLDAALKSFTAVQEAMRGISRGLEAVARASMVEERHKGTPAEGLYLKANRGLVVTADGKRPFPNVEFFWRSPPPSDQEIRLFDAKGEPTSSEGRTPFYACCGQAAGPNRVFVFPPPTGVRILADEDVSWFYQVPMADLTSAERDRERDYRQQHGIRCPLTTLPE